MEIRMLILVAPRTPSFINHNFFCWKSGCTMPLIKANPLVNVKPTHALIFDVITSSTTLNGFDKRAIALRIVFLLVTPEDWVDHTVRPLRDLMAAQYSPFLFVVMMILFMVFCFVLRFPKCTKFR